MGAPLSTLLCLALFAAPLAVVGWMMRFNFGMLAAGIVWPLVIVGGAMLAVLALGLAFGWPLIWAAVGAEGADAFEAISRAFTYVFHRPFYYAIFAAEAAVVGVAGWLLVNLFVGALVLLSHWAVSWGLGNDPRDLILSEGLWPMASAGAGLIKFWNALLVSTPMAFLFGYLWNGSTAVYFARAARSGGHRARRSIHAGRARRMLWSAAARRRRTDSTGHELTPAREAPSHELTPAREAPSHERPRFHQRMNE